MIKKLLGIVTLCAVLTSMTFTVFAAEISLQINNPQITVDGQIQPIDEEGTTPLIVNSRTLMPVRAVVEGMGGEVAWNGDTRTTTLTLGEDVIELTAGSTAALVNGSAQTMDTAPDIINSRTMLPIRFIAETFGYTVDYNENTQVILLTENSALAAEQPVEEAEEDLTEDEGRVLIAYYSKTGNTQALAQSIQAIVGGDLYEIEAVTPYPENYNDTIEQVRREMDEGFLPEIQEASLNLEDYDIIYVGSPVWYNNIALPVKTFLSQNDISGKTLIPFVTHGSSGGRGSLADLREFCPDNEVLDIYDTASGTESSIESWLREIGILN